MSRTRCRPLINLTVRQALSSDAPGILRCLRNAFAPYCSVYSPAAFTDTTLTSETLADRFAKMAIFVAVDRAGRIIGTLAGSHISGEEGHLRGMGCARSGKAKAWLSDYLAQLRIGSERADAAT
jgi:hypothetical protein